MTWGWKTGHVYESPERNKLAPSRHIIMRRRVVPTSIPEYISIRRQQEAECNGRRLSPAEQGGQGGIGHWFEAQL